MNIQFLTICVLYMHRGKNLCLSIIREKQYIINEIFIPSIENIHCFPIASDEYESYQVKKSLKTAKPA